MKYTINERNLVNHILALRLRHFKMGRFMSMIPR